MIGSDKKNAKNKLMSKFLCVETTIAKLLFEHIHTHA
jgi:hypothetical protein